MRDDTATSGAPQSEEPRAGIGRRALERVKNIPWGNALSGRWWWRWFRSSMIQSGRLTTLLALGGILWAFLENPFFLQLFQSRVFDQYQKIQPRALAGESPVAIIDIDEKSISELGQWPWPRTTIADMVRNATAAGAGVIGFDVVFAEADQTSLTRIADKMPSNMMTPDLKNQLAAIPTNDTVFATAIKESNNVVLGQIVVPQPVPYDGKIPPPPFAEMGDPRQFLEHHAGMLRPISELNNAAAGRGVFSVSGNFFDGIVRQVPMIVVMDDLPYPSLTLEMLRVKLRASTIGVKADARFGGVEQIFIRPRGSRDRFLVRTSGNSEVWPYFRPHADWSKQYVSATDVIHGRLAPDALKDKFVLVGTSAQGTIADLRSTPLDAVLPGVEVHANILENVALENQLTRTRAAPIIEFYAAAGIGLLMIIITPLFGAGVGLGIFAAIAGGMGWWSWNAFTVHHELYDPVFPILVAFLIYLFLAFAGYLRTEGQRKQVRSAFGQYLSPDLVKRLAEDPSKLTLGGENREMTFMFSDVRGFTAMSEIFDAQGLTRLINRLLTPLTTVILGNRGTIDKYMGDCIMAFWNAPLDVKDHASASCRAALAMVGEMKKLNAALEAEAKAENREHRPVAVGIGLNSGIACVGNMGSEQRFDYSVLGDSVNLASRLEGQSKSYGVTIIVGESTAAQSREFAQLELDLIKVKGKKHAVRIYTLLGDSTVAQTGWFKELNATQEAFLAAYRGQRWDEAEAQMQKALKIVEGRDGLAAEVPHYYEIFAERIAEFRVTSPGADWDGVYVATSK